ncbi:aldehyde dehydrogenase (NADP(+)) [Marinomonas sp. THO17]|uniref:aldehyde dehydrogenase (NADP(+)) n=1 Tax=Marinomonas sp. THO17 TaxID=3149048 RepID=UPI00336BF233
MITGQHFIAGQWVSSTTSFLSSPAEGDPQKFYCAQTEDMEVAVAAAEKAFEVYGYSSRSARANFLKTIAEEMEARIKDIVAIGTKETGLPEARLQGECGRTTSQLRLFAEHILEGDYLDRRIDEALPERQPLPRPELRMLQRPLGPVAVFGASNFPLAFSTAGGDTAAALAAGCTVVVKGHPAHPATGEIVTQAIAAAVRRCELPDGVFSLLQGDEVKVGQALVQHPLIRAVGFTGGLAGGRALFDLCAARPEPIPFFGELGSINPVFMMPQALKQRAQSLGEGWAASLTMGVGQFCTNPGVVVMLDNDDARVMIQAAQNALTKVPQQTMLTANIAATYHSGTKAVSELATPYLEAHPLERRQAWPALFSVSGHIWLTTPELHEEVFGPLGILVLVEDLAQMEAVARQLKGQLTCTLQMDEGDHRQCQTLLSLLERKAGRLLVNGFPTGVEVCDSMVHGGPYPASTNFGATSVGTLSIRRFLRPVCYQNVPRHLLPIDCQQEA